MLSWDERRKFGRMRRNYSTRLYALSSEKFAPDANKFLALSLAMADKGGMETKQENALPASLEFLRGIEMFKVWLKWDCGQDSIIFSTKGKAMEWVNKLYIPNFEFEKRGEFLNFHDLKAEGLCGIIELKVDP